ncbi:MAG: formate dehydrogenase accessory sulfurtransferase FdhD [Deltaproteobacteria bacterium]|nr:formate dehydrogenase accessory sulfurtransferase FdhD [Deltaproteobacteria bacterium]
MDDLFLKKRIYRFFDDGNIEELYDDVIREFRLLIRLDEHDFVHAVCIPFQLKEFVIGFLKTRGLIDSFEDIVSLDISGNIASVTRIRRSQGSVPKLNVLETTGTTNIDLNSFTRNRKIIRSDFRVASQVLLKGIQCLSGMSLYTRSGGTHCAILFSKNGEALVAAEDLGRHNAVDKVIGGGLKKRLDFTACWLAVSGRLPADMVLKPLLLSIPLVASVSAPTSEGVVLGERSGLTVVGFARGGRLNCYCHPERII